MIYGDIDSVLNNNCISPWLSEPVAEAMSLYSPQLSEGRYELKDKNFFLLQRYVTQKDAGMRYEAHNRYVDVQIVLSGHEKIFCADRQTLAADGQFEKDRDIGFFKDTEKHSTLVLSAKQFGLFFPGDAHKPCCMVYQAEPVEKIVVKIKLPE